MFQIAWVIGALIPVVPVIPVEAGLAAAGIAALVIQVVYVSATLVPVAAARRQAMQPPTSAGSPPERQGDITDLF